MEDLEKIKEFTDKVHLSDSEKTDLRLNILRAVRTETESRLILQRSSIFRSFNYKSMAFAIYLSLILSIGLGGAASFVAEGSLPGDALYPIKTSVNEKVKEVLAFSTEAKAEVEAEISERRLTEAAELAANDRFDDNARAKVEVNFERHAEKVKSRIEELRNKGKGKTATELSAKFENSLEVHARILEKLDGEEMGKFLPKVDAKKQAATNLRVKIESEDKAIGLAATATTSAAVDIETKEEDKDEKQETEDVDNNLYLRIKSGLGL